MTDDALLALASKLFRLWAYTQQVNPVIRQEEVVAFARAVEQAARAADLAAVRALKESDATSPAETLNSLFNVGVLACEQVIIALSVPPLIIVPPCPACVSEYGHADPACPHCHGTGRCLSAPTQETKG